MDSGAVSRSALGVSRKRAFGVGRQRSIVSSIIDTANAAVSGNQTSGIAVRLLIQIQKRRAWVLQVESRGNESDVGKCLRKVPNQPSRDWVIFLADQPQVITNGQQALEMSAGFITTPNHCQGVNEP